MAKSAVATRLLDKFLKRDVKIARSGYESETVLEDLVKHHTPLRESKASDMFNVSLEPTKEAFIIKVTGKDPFGRAAVEAWFEDIFVDDMKD